MVEREERERGGERRPKKYIKIQSETFETNKIKIPTRPLFTQIPRKKLKTEKQWKKKIKKQRSQNNHPLPLNKKKQGLFWRITLLNKKHQKKGGVPRTPPSPPKTQAQNPQKRK